MVRRDFFGDLRIMGRRFGCGIGDKASGTWKSTSFRQRNLPLEEFTNGIQPGIRLLHRSKSGRDNRILINRKTPAVEFVFAADDGVDGMAAHADGLHKVIHGGRMISVPPEMAHAGIDNGVCGL